MPRSSKRVTAWLASFSMLAGLFAPVICHLLPARSSVAAPWGEVCTSQGLVRIPLDDALAPQAPAKRKGGYAAGHCPFCAPHAGWFALPGLSGLANPSAEPAHFLPLLFLQSRPLFAWATAQPRAPPSFTP
ncbi:MAG: DUF2946 domain-containing protein [Burkholderiales bacterium]